MKKPVQRVVNRVALPAMNLGRCVRLLAWVLLGVSLLPLRAADPIPNSDCLQCHGDKELTRTNATGQVTSLFVEEAKIAASRHSTNTCWSCHRDIGTGHPDDTIAVKPVDCSLCHREQSESYGASVHGIALGRGEPGVATCKDCHGGHEVLPRSSPDSPLNAAHQGKTCGACHEQQSTEVAESVHGQALAQGKRDAPTCTDCHSEHKIEQLKGASPIRISEQVCSQCHASERINAKYRMPADRVKTFLGSYHGLAAQLGSTRAANCASCHGVHFILPSSNPRSSIHPAHLVETCGKCHPGATENFALGRIHTDLANGGDLGTIVNRWVRRVYLALIVVVVGVLASHNALLWWRKAVAARRASLGGEPRMDLGQRWQHLLLAVSFIILAWSGFALKYPDSWASWLLGADETIRRWSHRGAALILVGLGFFHLGYVCFTRSGRQMLRDFLPKRGDLSDLGQNVRYMRGRAAGRAHGARFDYAEKIEYWAVVWGTVIMGVTGFMIWFPVAISQFLPRWAVDVATTIHYYEAILACLAILVWHFYQVAFDPEVYPLNWSFWTGRKASSKSPKTAAPASPPAPPVA